MAIVVLLAILVLSYRQVIDAYPSGGGAYAVSRANLGTNASHVAAASLVVDYTLTVAVSIAAGVGQLTSAFPGLASATVPLCLGVLAVLTILNLRGLGDTARAFLLPTMIFIVGVLGIVVVGLVHPLALHAPQLGHPTAATHGLEAVGILLVLRAFAAGCSALTGVEAIANGVPLFRRPRQVRAKRTEALLGLILGAMLLGLAILAVRFHIQPRSGQTALSQIMGEAVGRHSPTTSCPWPSPSPWPWRPTPRSGGSPCSPACWPGTTTCLTSSSVRGDRQNFSTGIAVLAVFSAVLLVAVNGNTQRLIPMFAIGVFTGFTLSQTGLVVHWYRTRPPGWRRRATINAVGAAATAASTVIFLVSSSQPEGGSSSWPVVVFITLFRRIHRYYQRAAELLGLGTMPPKPQLERGGARHRPRHQHLAPDGAGPERGVVAVPRGRGGNGGAQRRRRRAGRHPEPAWDEWDPGVPLRVLHTEYASVVDPIVALIDEERARRRRPDRRVDPGGRPHPPALPAAAQPHRGVAVGGAADPNRRHRGARAHVARRHEPSG